LRDRSAGYRQAPRLIRKQRLVAGADEEIPRPAANDRGHSKLFSRKDTLFVMADVSLPLRALRKVIGPLKLTTAKGRVAS